MTADEGGHQGGQAHPLREGSELAGLKLQRLIARDRFCWLWLAAPAEEGSAQSCVRAIPVANLSCPDARDRFCSELSFWRNLPGRSAVELYDCGLSGDYCYMVMRYLPEGSAEFMLQRQETLQDRVPGFALDFAAALRDLHDNSGAHGNLKPSNVFPVGEGGVLLSD
ncbi:MAG: protein kinase family protein, partial [Candidatus Brocadiae bacterium]|nr:protein kinase family protein [Candidatus Brocadiia bacterium]